MPEYPSENAAFLHNGDIVNVGIDLPDKTFAEDVARVVTTANGGVRLILCGSGFPEHLPLVAGSRVVITRGEGKSLFHCTARLKDQPVNSSLDIVFPQRVTVSDRREYMRADVRLTVHYYIPKCQDLGRVISEWDRLKDCRGECGGNYTRPMTDCDSRVNLSGSGLRFKLSDCLPYGTLLHLRIELPKGFPDHIHAVGAIVRTKELIPEMDRIEYYSSSMSFRMIESADRQKLISHILTEQQSHRNETPPGYL